MNVTSVEAAKSASVTGANVVPSQMNASAAVSPDRTINCVALLAMLTDSALPVTLPCDVAVPAESTV